MGFKYCSLSSGSSGNCQYIETDNVKVLIDGGLSGKKIETLLKGIGVQPDTIDSILVTHEHTDHIKGVGILSRRYDIPIWANENTWISMEDKIGEIREDNIKVFTSEEHFNMKDLGIYPFKVSHDAKEPVGYCLYYKNIKISILTDTGWVNDSIKDHIKGSSLYLIESNHDVEMLKVGKYPYYLKRRIMSEKGHLSNEDAGKLITEIARGKGEIILLAHLSKENNFPLLAYETVKNIAVDAGIDVNDDINLDLTFREKATRVYNF